MSRLRPYIGITAVVALAIGVSSVFAQTTSSVAGDTVLRALLEEIRTLRVSLQRNSAYELRGRLLLDRARMHQENIRELSREVENGADFMRPTSLDSTWETENAMVEMNMEARAAGVQDPEERKKMIEREKQQLERRKVMEAQHREQMRQRFQRMETRLAEERDKLRLIEDELTQMHRELTGAAAKN